MLVKKTWQPPLVKSIDNLGTVLGACVTGNTVGPDDPNQCSQGGGPGTGSACSRGSGAKLSCGVGNSR